jgi:hypothetical protein
MSQLVLDTHVLIWWLPILPLAPWPIILPLIYLAFANRARKSVDSLLKNAAAMASG